MPLTKRLRIGIAVDATGDVSVCGSTNGDDVAAAAMELHCDTNDGKPVVELATFILEVNVPVPQHGQMLQLESQAEMGMDIQSTPSAVLVTDTMTASRTISQLKRVCARCGAEIGERGTLCKSCDRRGKTKPKTSLLNQLPDKYQRRRNRLREQGRCTACGVPLPDDRRGKNLCSICQSKKEVIASLRRGQSVTAVDRTEQATLRAVSVAELQSRVASRLCDEIRDCLREHGGCVSLLDIVRGLGAPAADVEAALGTMEDVELRPAARSSKDAITCPCA